MEVASQPDIMGEFRPEVEDFYRRDEVRCADIPVRYEDLPTQHLVLLLGG